MFAPLFLYAFSRFKKGKKVCFVFFKMIVFGKENNPYLCASKNDSVAQLVEQLTLNQWVEGSSPSGVTSKSSTYKGFLCRCFFISQQFQNIWQIRGTFQLLTAPNFKP